MSARNADPVDVRWYVSSYSTQTSGNCVETGVGVADWVGVRDTKNRGGGMLPFPVVPGRHSPAPCGTVASPGGRHRVAGACGKRRART